MRATASPDRPATLQRLRALAPDRRRWRRPATAISRSGSSSRRSSTGRSRSSSLDERPIFITRLVADSGCSIPGDAGRRAAGSAIAIAMRSCTSWRAVEDCRCPLEEQHDRRQAGDRLRADHVEARRAVQRLLHRDRDQLFDLRRWTCRAPRSGSRLGGANSGKTSTGMSRSASAPKTSSATAERDHEEAELQARPDDPPHHGRGLRAITRLRSGTRCRAAPGRRRSRPGCRPEARA